MPGSKRWGRGWSLLAALALLTRCAEPPPSGAPAAAPEPVAALPAQPQPEARPEDGGTQPPPPPGDAGARPAPSALRTLTFGATADTTTEPAAGDAVLGAAPTLRVGRSSEPTNRALEAVAHLRFEPTGLQGTVTRALLRLYALEGSPDGAALQHHAWDWQEDTLPASTSYAFGSWVRRTGAVKKDSWVELDVTAAVSASGQLDVVLVPDLLSDVTTGQRLVFASREHPRAELRPQLVVTEDTAHRPPAGEQSGCSATWTTQVLLPTDDATVRTGEPAGVEGSGPRLRVGGAGGHQALVRFAMPRLEAPEPVRLSVRLRLFAPEGGAAAPRLASADLWWWEEHTLPQNPYFPERAAPAPGPVPRGSWVEYDVTGWLALQPQGAVGFILQPAADAELQLYSREAEQAHLRPQLLVTRGAPCASRGEGGALTWSRQYGGPQPEQLVQLATAADGSFAVLGRGRDFGGTPQPDNDGWVLARYSADGTHLWSRAFPWYSEAGRLDFTDLAVSADGSLAVVGSYERTPDLGAGPLPASPGSPALFVARYTADGAPLWSRGFAGELGLSASDVATDSQGNVAVIGSLFGTVDFGGGLLRGGAYGGSKDTFVGSYLLVLDPLGVHRGSTALPNAPEGTWPESSFMNAVAFDSRGHVLLGGNLGEGSALGGVGAYIPFVARYAPTGALQWYRRFDGLHGSVESVAAGPEDALVFGGHFSGRHTFAGREHASEAGADILLGALSAEGKELWARSLPGSGGGYIQRLVVDDAGHLTVVGGVDSGDLGGGRLAPGRFIARYALADGAHRWSHRLMHHVWDEPLPFALASQPGGRTLLGLQLPATPQAPYTLPFDPTPFVSRGETDLLLLQLAP